MFNERSESPNNHEDISLERTLNHVSYQVMDLFEKFGFRLSDVTTLGPLTEFLCVWIDDHFELSWSEFCQKNLSLDRTLLLEVLSKLSDDLPLDAPSFDQVLNHVVFPLEHTLRRYSIVTPATEGNPVVERLEEDARSSAYDFIGEVLQQLKAVDMDEGFEDIADARYQRPSQLYSRFILHYAADPIFEVLTIQNKKYLAFYVHDDEDPDDDDTRKPENYFIILNQTIVQAMTIAFWNNQNYEQLRAFKIGETLDNLQLSYLKLFLNNLKKIAEIRKSDILEPFKELRSNLHSFFWAEIEKYLEQGDVLSLLWQEDQEVELVKHAFVWAKRGEETISITVVSPNVAEHEQVVMLQKRKRRGRKNKVWCFVNGGNAVGNSLESDRPIQPPGPSEAELIVHRLVNQIEFPLPDDLTEYDEENDQILIEQILTHLLASTNIVTLINEVNRLMFSQRYEYSASRLTVLKDTKSVTYEPDLRKHKSFQTLPEDYDVSRN